MMQRWKEIVLIQKAIETAASVVMASIWPDHKQSQPCGARGCACRAPESQRVRSKGITVSGMHCSVQCFLEVVQFFAAMNEKSRSKEVFEAQLRNRGSGVRMMRDLQTCESYIERSAEVESMLKYIESDLKKWQCMRLVPFWAVEHCSIHPSA